MPISFKPFEIGLQTLNPEITDLTVHETVLGQVKAQMCTVSIFCLQTNYQLCNCLKEKLNFVHPMTLMSLIHGLRTYILTYKYNNY